jgi:hypothetical protein
MTGANFSSWYRQDEGTLYAEASAPTVNISSAPTVVSAEDGTTNNRIQFRKNAGGSAASTIVVSGGAIQYLDQAAPTWTGVMAKLAMVYKVNDFIACVNSTLNTADTSGTIPVVTQLKIGNGTGAGILNGHIRKIAYYPLRLTNSQLQALTAV